jgi:predicted kinase
MDRKAKCIIVTGRAGAGKTTLAKKLGERLWTPVISRDEIKEGYVNTYGIKHDQLPPETNKLTSEFFFWIVNEYLRAKISIVIEAAFQHDVWESRMPAILEVAVPFFVVCEVDSALAARRHLERGLKNPDREFYHGDQRVAHYRKTGEILPPEPYAIPNFNLPTWRVLTDGGDSVDEILDQIKKSVNAFPNDH